jgi:hypothetical protein
MPENDLFRLVRCSTPCPLAGQCPVDVGFRWLANGFPASPGTPDEPKGRLVPPRVCGVDVERSWPAVRRLSLLIIGRS